MKNRNLDYKISKNKQEIRGVQKTRQTRPDPTRQVGSVLGLGGSGWVRLGLGHKITNPSNLTRHDPPIF